MLWLRYGGSCAGADRGARPRGTPIPTPSPEDLGGLEFVIEGPDESMPMTIKYSDFDKDGKYTLEDLLPGTYTVTEVDPDQLLTGLAYTFDEENSVQSVTIEVKAETETASRGRGNAEEHLRADGDVTHAHAGSDRKTPSPTPTPDPQPEEKISIPVTKVWDDMGNRDGNRPDMVIVYLLADGNRTAQAVLNAANGWSWQFTDLPKYPGREGDRLYRDGGSGAMYTARSTDSRSRTSTRRTTSVTVSKVWADNNNSAGLRPLSIYCTLSNGISVELNEANGWTATVDNLPLIVNGQPAEYTWHEQEVIGYSRPAKDSGNTTVFTNTVIERNGGAAGRQACQQAERGENYLIIEDYGTPLGVEVVINHVGDCFD